MKKHFIKFGLLLLVITVTFTSCKKDPKDKLKKDIAIENKEHVFEISPATKGIIANTAEEVLYDGVIEMNIAKTLEDNGLSFDLIKSFIITQGSIVLVEPLDFNNMQGFSTIKLYFDNQEKIVAQAQSVEQGVVKLSIVNGELLDKLKQDKLRVIIVGKRPLIKVKLKLITNYKATVGLI